MRFFLSFIKQRIGGLVLLALCSGVFAVTFALYDLPLGAVAYPALICALFWLGFTLAGSLRAWRKHRRLEQLAQLSAARMEGMLPQPETVEDRDYQEIIRLLRQEQREREAATDRRYGEMVEYYTLWAHQIKTPIASMGLALQNEDTPLSRRLMTDLIRVEQYVDMVLAFLRLDSTSSDYMIRECDLDGVIRGAVKKFSAEFIQRKVRLEYTPTSATVLTDEKWLAFVIEQVLSNALKYTPAGEIRIYAEPGPVLCVADTGMGIAPSDLPRVFERGYTGHNGRADKRASGIGLYLCKRICDNLGHTLAIESEVGRGTTVRIGLERAALEVE